eukprot:COSAG06_NODE_11837_length_1458_cov_1.654893_2_plen_86_part_00
MRRCEVADEGLNASTQATQQGVPAQPGHAGTGMNHKRDDAGSDGQRHRERDSDGAATARWGSGLETLDEGPLGVRDGVVARHGTR